MTEPTDLTPKETAERIVEAEVNRRVVAALAEQNIKRELQEIVRRLDKANHLKAEMVTKADFKIFTDNLGERMSRFITREDLGDGEFWIKHGVMQFDAEEQKLARLGLEQMAVNEHNRRASDRAVSRSDNRAYWIAAIFGGLTVLISALAWLHPHLLR